VEVRRASCRGGRPACKGLLLRGGLQGGGGGGGERPLPVRAGDGGVAGLGGVGGLLFSLGKASEGRIVSLLPFLGSSAGLLLGQVRGDLLLLEVGEDSRGGLGGGQCAAAGGSSGSRVPSGGLGVGGASGRGAGHGTARQEAGAHGQRGKGAGAQGCGSENPRSSSDS
jgi:hypothetical protein